MARNPLYPDALQPVEMQGNDLIGYKPTLADGWDYNAKAYGDWVAQQRADLVARGLADPQTGWPTQAGWVDAAKQVGKAILMGTTAPEMRGVVYHRFTNGPVNNSGVGHMMYAEDPYSVAHYGQNHYELDSSQLDPKEIVDASSKKFQSLLKKSLKSSDFPENYQVTPAELAADAAPGNIVDGAGLWDNPDLVSHVWDNVMAPNGWTAAKTPDGIVSFDPAHATFKDDAHNYK